MAPGPVVPVVQEEHALLAHVKLLCDAGHTTGATGNVADPSPISTGVPGTVRPLNPHRSIGFSARYIPAAPIAL